MANWMKLRAYARHRGVTLAAVQKAVETGRVTAVRRNEKGWLVGIDQEQADREWAERTDPSEAAKNGQVLRPGVEIPRCVQVPGAAAAVADAAAPEGAGNVLRLKAPAGAVNEQPVADGGQGTGLPAVDGGAADGIAAPPASQADDVGGSVLAGKGDEHGYHQARAKREQYAAKDAELSYLERVGTLVPAADVRAETFELFRQVRDNMMLVPDRIASRLTSETDPMQVHRMLTESIRGALSELSRAFAAESARGAGQRADAVQ